jgi:dCTP deaminase
MIKNDKWIKEMAQKGMITPFVPEMVRQVSTPSSIESVISYGLGSYGYDIRLSPREFKVFRRFPGLIVDPKGTGADTCMEPVRLREAGVDNESYFILPAHSYGLGVAVERLDMPRDVTALCIGKSTYARWGIIANLTPIEAGWKGHLTLEFSNSSDADVRLYANEGIAQLLFFQGEDCSVSYADRGGKYQDQQEEITHGRA